MLRLRTGHWKRLIIGIGVEARAGGAIGQEPGEGRLLHAPVHPVLQKIGRWRALLEGTGQAG